MPDADHQDPQDDMWEERIEWIADEWEVEIPIDVPGADTLVAFTSIEVMFNL